MQPGRDLLRGPLLTQLGGDVLTQPNIVLEYCPLRAACVVERFTISPDGKSLKAIVTVNDPDTFNGPLTLTQTWRKDEVEMIESICAEDGGYDPFEQNLFPIPKSEKPDF